jgi:hypothetical protein
MTDSTPRERRKAVIAVPFFLRLRTLNSMTALRMIALLNANGLRLPRRE